MHGKTAPLHDFVFVEHPGYFGFGEVDEDSRVFKLRQLPRWSLHLTSYGATVRSASQVALLPEGLDTQRTGTQRWRRIGSFHLSMYYHHR